MKNHYLKPKQFTLTLLGMSSGMIFKGFFMESETYDMNYFGVAYVGIFLFYMAFVTFLCITDFSASSMTCWMQPL